MMALLIPLTVALSAPKADEAFDPARSAVCVRREYTKTDDAGQAVKVANIGSGTVVAQENGLSLILTNHHVCPETGEWVRVAHRWRRYDAQVVLAVERYDLAALVVFAKLSPSGIARTTPKPGAELRMCGYGLMLPCLKVGRATDRYADEQGVRTHFTTLATESGDSGSGLFDASGRLAGVVWGSQGAAVPLESVRAFARHVAETGGQFPLLAKELR